MRGKKNEYLTRLFCDLCGTRLLWRPENRVAVSLEPDGTVHGLTLHAACVTCQATYEGWIAVNQAPEGWKVTRADTSRSFVPQETLKKKKRLVQILEAGT